MDGNQFDDLIRSLAKGTSRRGLLRGLLGAGAGARALRGRGDGHAAADKVLICHLTGSESNPIVLIEVSVNAIPAHEAHGDTIDPDFETDVNNCGGCGIVCDDGDPCTIDTCEGGLCVNTPIVCNDGNPCTDDVCVDGSCVFTPVLGRPCDDGDACTGNDACDETGACVGGDISCEDGDPCTIDSCDPAVGCISERVICPVGQVCEGGECVCEEIFTCGDEVSICGTGGEPPLDLCGCTGSVEGLSKQVRRRTS